VIIHFLGGIHEIYFPYVLMNPLTIVAVTAGATSANFCFLLTSAGLAATPSPGSIFAEIALAPKGGLFPVLLGIAVGTVVAFLIAAPLVRRMKVEESDRAILDKAVEQMHAAKTASKGAVPPRLPVCIVFACDAGMGSSVIGQSILKQKLQQAGLEARVEHSSVSDLSPSAEVVVSHASLSPRVRAAAPGAAVYAVEDFINSPVYDEIVAELKRMAGR
jgi:PTS system mannitol-specific IIC component